MKSRKPQSRKQPSPIRKRPPARRIPARRPKSTLPENLSPFFDSALDLLCIGDYDGNFQKLNPEWEKTLGFPLSEMIGKPYIDFIHPDDRPTTDKIIQELDHQKEAVTVTNRVRCKDGTYRWLEWKAFLRNKLVYASARDITAHKRAEKALRDSEERYQRISRTITDYIYHVRVENGKAAKTLHSRRCLAVTGYTVEEFEADPNLWLRMVDPQDRPQVEEQARTVLSGGDAPVIEHRLWRKEGIRRWVRNTPVLHSDPQGRLLGYDGLIQDITERKEAELLLHTQHELALSLSATINMKEGLRLCLETAMRVSGMEAGGVYLTDPGTGAMDMIVDQDLPPDLANLVRHLEPGRPEARWMMEGKPIYTDFDNLKSHMPLIPRAYEGLHAMIGIPIRHENLVIGCLNLVSSKVDAIPPSIRETLETTVAQIGNAVGRLRSEAALRESRQMLETVLNTIPARVFWKDRRLIYMGCNRAFAQDAGFNSPEEIVGIDDYKIGWGDHTETYRLDDQSVIDSGTAKLNYEESAVNQDGRKFWVSTSKIPLRDPQGNIRGVLGTYEDITGRKRVEEEIRALNAELEHRVAQRTAQLEDANRELEAFTFSVSHDLRAPLRAIDGFTQVLEEDYGNTLDAEGKRLCGIIRRNTRSMNGLIDDLLVLSRLSRAEMEYMPTDMGAMVQSVFQELVPPESRARIDFQTGRLPAVSCDPILLRQVWINLISNAIKFSQTRDKASIRVECLSTPEEDAFSIRDNGAGFDMQYADRLFAVFQRLHNASEFDGTGVGLAIVQRAIHRHGGRVWAEGAVDQGATFHFTLPKK